jgi:predicted metal-dependent enzyme (double-stranded beta helix superfamily)
MNPTITTTNADLMTADRLEQLSSLPAYLAVAEAAPLLGSTLDRARLLGVAADLLGSTSLEPRPTFRTLLDEPGFSLQVFAWPAGSYTPIHDHTSWGVYVCLAGQLVEDRYTRLDDGAQPTTARLRRTWRRAWLPGEQSVLLPYEGGIHRVANPGTAPAVSLHLYGPRLGVMDGRDYDPRRDYVCDRPVEVSLN